MLGRDQLNATYALAFLSAYTPIDCDHGARPD